MKYKIYLEDEYNDFKGDLDPDMEVEANELYGLDYHISVYCRYLHDERDGWEWMRGSNERIIAVDESGEMSYYVFEVDYEPVFYVSEHKDKTSGD